MKLKRMIGLSAMAATLALNVHAAPDWSFVPGSGFISETTLRSGRFYEMAYAIRNSGTSPGAISSIEVAYNLVSTTNVNEVYPVAWYLCTNSCPPVSSARRTLMPAPNAIGASMGATNYFQHSAPPGEYYLRVTIDPDEELLDESRNNNNLSLGPVVKVLTPELGIEDEWIYLVGTNLYLDAGSPFTVEFTYENHSELADIPSFAVDYYLVNTLSHYPNQYNWYRGFNPETAYFVGRRFAPGLTAAVQQHAINLGGQAKVPISETFNLPGGLDTALYWVGVHINADDAVEERYSHPNLLSPNTRATVTHDITVAYVYERPDLRGSVGTMNASPTSLEAGQTLTVSGLITNSTAWSEPIATSSRFSLFLHNGTSLAPSTTLNYPLGTRWMGAVPPLGTIPFSHNFTVPLSVPPGTYMFAIRVDDPDLIPERTEPASWNYAYLSPITITAPSLPDLEIWHPGNFSPADVQPGDTVTLETRLKNNGFGISSAFDVQYVLSVDTTVGNGDDILLGTYRYNDFLNLGETATVSPTFAIPSSPGPTPGLYRIFATVDSSEEMTEIDEDNNVRQIGTSRIRIEPADPDPLPDLLPEEIDFPSDFVSYGASLPMTILMGNLAFPPVPGYKYSVYLSQDLIVGNADDIFLETANAGPIGGGDEVPEDINLTMPGPGIPAGPYYFVVVVDSGEDVEEEDELNNIRLFEGDPISLHPVTSGQYPALSVKGGVHPMEVPTEGQLAHIALVGNEGGTNVHGLITDVILSSNSTIGDGDDILLTRFGPMELGALTETNLVADLTLPSSVLPGNYLVAWVVDPDGVIPEVDTSDNVFTTEIMVRERNTRLEWIEKTSTRSVLGLTEPAPGYAYRLEMTDGEFGNWTPTGASQDSHPSFPLVFELLENDDMKIFRVAPED